MEKTMTITLTTGEKITASKSTLNLIAIWAQDSTERYRRLGYNGLEKEAMNATKAIYEQLKETGYYNKKS